MAKSKIALTIIMIAALGLSGYLYTQMASLKIEVATLTTQTSVMVQQVDDLQNNLQEKVTQIQSQLTTITQLQEQKAQLQSQIDDLEVSYESLSSDYDQLEIVYNELSAEYSVLEAENMRLSELIDLYEKVPKSYYQSNIFSQHSNTYTELCSFLKWDFRLPRDYESGVFDCSETSAYLEWALEDAGFNAKIAVGLTPWDPDEGYHAWVLVNTEEYQVAIESTAFTGEFSDIYPLSGRTPGVIYGNDSRISYWENYYNGYEYLFNNIYHAIKKYNSHQEWNWWEEFWGFI